MASYIDADRLLQVLEINFGHTGGADTLKQLINNQPTADVVEVVRCKDCAKVNRYKDRYFCRCDNTRMNANDFCSYGERKGEKDVKRNAEKL